MIGAIVAANEDRVIGVGNGIPWSYKGDFKFFEKVTRGSTVVMGRTTWESLPKRPLRKRNNYIVTRYPSAVLNLVTKRRNDVLSVWTSSSVTQALELSEMVHEENDVWFMGGEGIYREGFAFCDVILLTNVPDVVSVPEGAKVAKLPDIPKTFKSLVRFAHPFSESLSVTVFTQSPSNSELLSLMDRCELSKSV